MAATAIACGDSATGSDIPEPDGDGGTIAKDGGSSGKDGSVIPGDTGASSSGNVDSGPQDSGLKSDGGLPTVSVTALDFGEVDCGGTGTVKTFMISNPSGAAVSFTTELVKAGASPYALSPANGSIPAGGAVEITVTPKAVAVPSSTTANALGDTVKLTIGPTNAQVDLKQTAHGVSLKLLTNSGSDFGNVPTTATGALLPLQIANAGNQAAPITLTVVPDPSGDAGANAMTVVDTVASPAPTTATPGITAAQVSFLPTAVQPYSQKVHVEIGAGVALCDVAPPDVTFVGKGTNGVVSVSPVGLTFGNAGVGTTDCGTQAGTQAVTITNSSNKSILIKSAALGKGTTFFSLTNLAVTGKDAFTNLTVLAGATTTISVVPKLIPQNNGTNPTALDAFSDVLTITTDAPGDTDPHIIPLHQTAHGAYVTRTTNAINLGTSPVGVTVTAPAYSVQNVGNADITLNQTLQQGASSPFTVSSGSLNLTGGAAPTSLTATFTAAVAGATSDNAVLTQPNGSAVVLCNTLPGALVLSGTGGASSISTNVAGNTLNFSFVACNTTAGPKTVKLTNNGPATTFTANLQKAAASGFRINTTPAGAPTLVLTTTGPIGAGASVDIVIQPNLVPVGNVPTNNAINDILELTTGNVGAPTNITINETPFGAYLDFNGQTTTKSLGSTQKGTTSPAGSQAIVVRNQGNQAVDALTLMTGTSSPAGTTFSITDSLGVAKTQPVSIAVPAAGNNTVYLSFSPPGPIGGANILYTSSFTASAPATPNYALCSTLPLAIPLSGTATP